MSTCLCDAFYAEAAMATVEILEYLGCEIAFPEGQTCCGQPSFNAGDWEATRKLMRYTRKVFDGEDPIILPSGSCTAMLDHGSGLAFEDQEDCAEQAAWARRAWELCDYLVHGLGQGSWPGRFPGRVSLHRSCHTRGTRSYESAVQLLESIDGLELTEVGELEQCCGFGGTFSVSFPNISKGMGELKIKHLMEGKPDVIAALDMACMMHFGGMMDREGIAVPRMHVAVILRDALRNAGKLSHEAGN
jgi:L-lactate dehydrogenase complex protein LldE